MNAHRPPTELAPSSLSVQQNDSQKITDPRLRRQPLMVGKLLRDLRDYPGHPVTLAALELAALLLLRPGELRQLEWAWVDLPGALMKLPAALMKRGKAEKTIGRPHLVPLAPQSVELLAGLQRLTGAGRHVFPGLTNGQRCLSENAVPSALRLMGYAHDDLTVNGFRVMAGTMLAKSLGVDSAVIDAQLDHTGPDTSGQTCEPTRYLAQRIAMMSRWADFIDELRFIPNECEMPTTTGNCRFIPLTARQLYCHDGALSIPPEPK